MASDVLADAAEGQRRDAGTDRVDLLETLREAPNDGRGQRGEARRARETEHTGRACPRVEHADAGDEVRAVREIEIMHPRCDARVDEAEAVRLKGSARVDDDGRSERCQLCRHVPGAIERSCLESRSRPAPSNEVLGAL